MSGMHTPGREDVGAIRSHSMRLLARMRETPPGPKKNLLAGQYEELADKVKFSEGWNAALDAVESTRLIAAAPCLLSACETALKQLSVAVIANSGGMFTAANVHEHPGVGQLIAAISRATGETGA